MSRVAKKPIDIPQGVDIILEHQKISVKSSKGYLDLPLHPRVEIVQESKQLRILAKSDAKAIAGTFRALIYNMVVGVTQGFEKRLELVGVGYRAQVQGQRLQLTLGFSHPVAYEIPQGIIIETPAPTEIVIKGMNKQLVGQVAANIRQYRFPDPYKGKGVRYKGEKINLKEVKKK